MRQCWEVHRLHSLPSSPCLHSTSVQHPCQHEGSAEVLEACLSTDAGGLLHISENKARPHMHIHENQAQKQGTAAKKAQESTS
jgi:hypothetical protein